MKGRDVLNSLNEAYQNYMVIQNFNSILRKELELNVVEVIIIDYLKDKNEPVDKDEMVKDLSMTKKIAYTPLRKLRQGRYIKKERDLDDERISILFMTDEMKENAEMITQEAHDLYKRFLDGEFDETSKKDNDDSKNNDSESNESENDSSNNDYTSSQDTEHSNDSQL